MIALQVLDFTRKPDPVPLVLPGFIRADSRETLTVSFYSKKLLIHINVHIVEKELMEPSSDSIRAL
jgi:hypothetical protein